MIIVQALMRVMRRAKPHVPRCPQMAKTPQWMETAFSVVFTTAVFPL
jgi:hypothetical protein